MASGWPQRRLKRVLLPTLGRPTMARIGRLLTFDLCILERGDRVVAELSELAWCVFPLVRHADEQLQVHLLLHEGLDSLPRRDADGLDLTAGLAHHDLALTHLFYMDRG